MRWYTTLSDILILMVFAQNMYFFLNIILHWPDFVFRLSESSWITKYTIPTCIHTYNSIVTQTQYNYKCPSHEYLFRVRIEPKKTNLGDWLLQCLLVFALANSIVLRWRRIYWRSWCHVKGRYEELHGFTYFENRKLVINRKSYRWRQIK